MWLLIVVVAVSAALVPPAQAEDPPVFLVRWGSVGFGPGQFRDPGGIATDPAGNVYVTDGNSRVQKFTGNGAYLAEWSVPAVSDILVDGTGLIYTSSSTGFIRVYDSSFNLVRQWETSPYVASYLALDPTEQTLYALVGDHIFVFTTDGTFLRQWQYSENAPPYGFGVGASGHIYKTDGYYNVHKLTPYGTFVLSWGGRGSGEGEFIGAKAVAVDAAEDVYVSDGNGRIQKFTDTGSFLTLFGDVGPVTERVSGAVHDLAVDTQGNIFALDTGWTAVFKFGGAPTPTRSSTWGRLKALYR